MMPSFAYFKNKHSKLYQGVLAMGLLKYLFSHYKKEDDSCAFGIILFAFNIADEEDDEEKIIPILEEIENSNLIEVLVIAAEEKDLLRLADCVKGFNFTKSCIIIAVSDELRGAAEAIIQMPEYVTHVLVCYADEKIYSDILDELALASKNTGASGLCNENYGILCRTGNNNIAYPVGHDNNSVLVGYPMAFEKNLLLGAINTGIKTNLCEGGILEIAQKVGINIKLVYND